MTKKAPVGKTPGLFAWGSVRVPPRGRQSAVTLLEQFQEKCVTVFRLELRKNKKRKRFGVSVKR
ncbi:MULTISPECIES: hypothetical protein [Mesorhizobium]|uniref:Uncharacterized protein n=1 Tax=Mesorhizobium shonense TaxID=1209948 RepID=A0ABV2HQE5_9HYPH|nr:hypothetical protein [Mesorhizobium sp.]RWB15824.1 MAG: hypothetical protein EOQ40_28190 [Mesorhizobium sp.]RWE00569.1 MAG: hypothetical protein EOS40_15130 [Mesorhizobium sp.]TIS47789.1 MAG: hypothetical protein E5W96_21985 [Mesorhizobium sp.]